MAEFPLSCLLGNLSNPEANTPIFMMALTPRVPVRDESSSLQTTHPLVASLLLV